MLEGVRVTAGEIGLISGFALIECRQILIDRQSSSADC